MISALRRFFRQAQRFIAIIALFPFSGAAISLQAQDFGSWSALGLSIQTDAGGSGQLLTWDENPGIARYTLLKTMEGAPDQLIELPGGAVEYHDKSVPPGMAVEYRLAASPLDETKQMRYGQLLTGREIPLTEDKGGILLIVTAAMRSAAGVEIDRLINDLVGEGYSPEQRVIDNSATVGSVKTWILDACLATPSIRSLLLIGAVPVPYSGKISPDGHSDHYGAWPCDGYYGDPDESLWQDASVNLISARPSNTNVPGDGKFDVSRFPGAVELAVGRLDFSGLPAFLPLTEGDLLRRYLNKNHAWRTGRIPEVNEQALINDNLPFFQEGLSAATRRAASALNGKSGVVMGDFLNPSGRCYTFGAGIGFGSFDSIIGVVGSADLAAGRVDTAFNQMMGSYSGEWSSPNNIIRSVIAAPGISVASWWSGRPNIHLYPMALGSTTGDCTRRAMSPGITQFMANGYSANQIHIGLMGDPTLKLRNVAQVTSAAAISCHGKTLIRWAADPATKVTGWILYRSEASGSGYTRCHPGLLTGRLFIDQTSPAPGVRYLIRAVRLESTASGTWWNASTGTTIKPDATTTSQYEAWSTLMIPDASGRGDDQDPDQDGKGNLQEYLCGTDPICPDAGEILSCRHNADGMEMIFSRLAGITDAKWYPEQSHDLLTWESVPIAEEILKSDGYVQCRCRTQQGAGRGFLRLQAIRKLPGDP